MVNNRILAVAAVLALAVPAMGAAAPIVSPPTGTREQLVEGHTVFTVIEVVRQTTITRADYAAAVAVLVREYDSNARALRFPGVLWFNDQYLVNPSAQNAANAVYRYPCGGAVMAVNAGDEDPRVILVGNGNGDETRDAITAENAFNVTNREGVDYGDDNADPTPTNNADDPDYAWVNVTTDGEANSDTVLGSSPVRGSSYGGIDVDGDSNDDIGTFDVPVDYEESYFITDPNDHVWIIDKYTVYHRSGTSTLSTTPPGLGADVVHARPVWVVNILGSPVFIPDDGVLSCGPYNDLVSAAVSYTAASSQGAAAAQMADDAVGPTYDSAVYSRYPYRDTPPAGYSDPSRGGLYCYQGSPTSTTACPGPVRLYNALLYFLLEDLDQPGAAPRDHSAPTTSGDTNGCQTGTEWQCPAGDDNREGNSHPFHPADTATTTPTVPYPNHYQACPNGAYGAPVANRANHGGSTDPFDRCDFLHATFNIDLYFSPAGRPFAPIDRDFEVEDYEGSASPFQDYHCSYEGAPCEPANYEPGGSELEAYLGAYGP